MSDDGLQTRLGAAMDLRFDESVREFAAYLHDVGLDHIELKREYLHSHPNAPSPRELSELRREYDLTFTLHAPFRDWNLGSFNDASRRASVEQVKRTLDDAAAADAGAVVVHGGSVPRRYPDPVREKAKRNAIQSLSECAEHAAHVGIPLCLENQPRSDSTERHTTTPSDLEGMITDVGADSDWLKLTLDVGHATVNGYEWRTFVERFGNRIEIVHLHDNDGTNDDHEPLQAYGDIGSSVDASYFVFEMKRVDDIATCVGEAETNDTAK
ncbi:sugar phosphate isomerase/epimerase family protein [Haladaptatus sp. DYF46]|uniref:sugar phosphate isomerase/epimerase family protein n=1 Tax=Haladaptatus sp. DYF46 TaxID=2886041 RepID=UPI001E3C0DF3|nr:sugar phosphate isomerase/epimerase family protein [Haladaptatus sp. DYF46]